MMKTTRKGYIAPGSNRRETLGMTGAFLVFLLSLPGHADLLASQTRHLFQELVSLALVFLGILTPVVHSPAAHFHQAIAKIHRNTPMIAPSLSSVAKPAVRPEITSVSMNMIPRQLTYVFEGKATLHDQPSPNASVLVRLTYGAQSVTQGTFTGPDGSYRLHATIAADAGDPVDWTLEAYTPDFKKVEIFGRKIVQRTEEQILQEQQSPIIVDAPVEFLASHPL